MFRFIQQWRYFSLIESESGREGYYNLIDEDGILLAEDCDPLGFDSLEEAEEYLIEHNIRGSVR